MSAKTPRFDRGRRRFLAGAAGTAVLATGAAGFPGILRAQPAAVKIGLVHPVTSFLQWSGTQCRQGALMAVEDVNAGGGIQSLGGARLEAVLGDSQSKADVGAAVVEKFNEAGVACIVGAYASGISLATTQTAAKYGIPHAVDVGVSDKIVQRGLGNTFRFGPGYGVITGVAVERLVGINDAAGKPVKTVMLVHENSTPFGSGTAKLLTARLTEAGFEVVGSEPHPTPNRDFNNIALKVRAANPDMVIPASYYNEYVLLARTLQRQRVRPKAIYSVRGGAASSFRFLDEFPDAAQYIMDCNHWYDPKNPAALALRKQAEAKGLYFTYEVYLAYTAVRLMADAVERAGSAEREAITAALAASTWDGHVMPYGPTRFVDGQNQGAQPLNTQILGKDVEVVSPKEYATAAAVFPRPA